VVGAERLFLVGDQPLADQDARSGWSPSLLTNRAARDLSRIM
jgi:hypothetical protein